MAYKTDEKLLNYKQLGFPIRNKKAIFANLNLLISTHKYDKAQYPFNLLSPMCAHTTMWCTKHIFQAFNNRQWIITQFHYFHLPR